MVTEPEWRLNKQRREEIERMQAEAQAAGDQTKVEVAQIAQQTAMETEAGRAAVERERIAATREAAAEKVAMEREKAKLDAQSKERLAYLETLVKRRHGGEGF